MASSPPPPPPPFLTESDHRFASRGTVIFSYMCVGLTCAAALLAVCVFYCHRHTRRRAQVTDVVDSGAAAEESGGPRAFAVDVASLPEFAYAGSARHGGGGGGGAQCSVCLGAVQAGEMVRLLPACKHLYHVECIDMWLVSHATCPLCRSEVEPQADGRHCEAEAAPAAEEETEPTQAPSV